MRRTVRTIEPQTRSTADMSLRSNQLCVPTIVPVIVDRQSQRDATRAGEMRYRMMQALQVLDVDEVGANLLKRIGKRPQSRLILK